MADFPDADSAKGYENVSRSDVNDYANECHNMNFRVTGFYTFEELVVTVWSEWVHVALF